MVALSQLALKGATVILFDPKVSNVNALCALHLINTSSTELVAGTASIMEGPRFMGQVALTPLVRDEEQLIVYGMDTKISVAREEVKLQSSVCVGVSVRYPASRGPQQQQQQQRPVDAQVFQQLRHIKTTKYTIANNSMEPYPTLYVDHAADSSHEGYAILTTDRLIKTATGFARYCFSLAPQQQIEFEVEEMAIYEEAIPGFGPLEQFLDKTLPKLEPGAVGEREQARLREVVKERRAACCLDSIRNLRFGSGASAAYVKTVDSIHTNAHGLRLPAALLKLLKDYEAQAKAVIEGEQQMSVLEKRREEIVSDQHRLRDNISSLAKVSGEEAVHCYVKELVAQEARLKEIATELGKLRERTTAARASIAELEDGLRFTCRSIQEQPLLSPAEK